MSHKCTICQAPTRLVTDSETFIFKGKPLVVDGLMFYECSLCNESFCDYALIIFNENVIRQSKESVRKKDAWD